MLTFKLIEFLIGNRVSAEVELGGLDIPETGVLAYPDFALIIANGRMRRMALLKPAAPWGTRR